MPALSGDLTCICRFLPRSALENIDSCEDSGENIQLLAPEHRGCMADSSLRAVTFSLAPGVFPSLQGLHSKRAPKWDGVDK